MLGGRFHHCIFKVIMEEKKEEVKVPESLNIVKNAIIKGFLEKKKIVPSAFMFKGGKVVNAVGFPCKNEKEKYAAFISIGSLCVKNNIDVLVVSAQVFLREVAVKDADYVMNNLGTESPELYPDSMRKKAIAFHYIDLTKPPESIMTCMWMYEEKEGVISPVGDKIIVGFNPSQSGMIKSICIGVSRALGASGIGG